MVTFIRNPIEQPLYEFLSASWIMNMSKSTGQSFQPGEIVRYSIDSTIALAPFRPGHSNKHDLINSARKATEVEVYTLSGDVFKWVVPVMEVQSLEKIMNRIAAVKIAEANRLEKEAELRAKATKPINALNDILAQANAMRPPSTPPAIVSLVPMPAPHGFTNDRKSTAPSEAYALKCDCTGTNFCNHILADIELGNDTNKWWSEITTRRVRPPDGRIEIGVPIGESVLHRIELTYVEQEAWDGSKLRQLKVNPRVWYDDTQSRFYDVSTPGEHKILFDQINILMESIVDTPDGQSLVEDCTKFAFGKGSISCGMATRQPGNFPVIGSHNFGTNKRLLDWIRTGPEMSRRVTALAFCLMTYGMCYICYSNREPMFSLVNM